MSTAQPGIFVEGTRAHYHLEFDVAAGADTAAVTAALAALRSGELNLVVGIGPDWWKRLAGPEQVPADLAPFVTIDGGGGRRAPGTQHDLWVWLHGSEQDQALDAARAVTATFASTATLAVEQAGFVYRDSRDLTGFIDGTENPRLDEAPGVALVPDGHPGSGGAHAVTMRWVHDLDAFGRLAVQDQEAVIGRTKPDSADLGARRPPSSHVSRVVVEEDGEELEIYRRSVPYGTVRELGLFFVAFSAERPRFDTMLARMFGKSRDGLYDRLTDYSRPVTGSYYFAPSLEDLDRACRQ